LPGTKAQRPLYTLAVASNLSGVSSHSIRQYIDKGVILPFKTETDRHLFSDVDIKRLKNIKTDLQDYGLNMAGIKRAMAQTPCWLIKACTEDERKECTAYNTYDQPCWLVEDTGFSCADVDCRDCSVYGLVDHFDHLKDVFKSGATISIPA